MQYSTVRRHLRRGFFPLTVAAGLLIASTAFARPPVEVVGLFKDRAFVRLGSDQILLKVGETSPEGFLLVSSSANKAVIEYQGERFDLILTERVGGEFKPAKDRRLSIASDQLGQYRVQGAINGQMVGFLVDTGASLVVLSENQANALGIDFANGQLGSVVTAQGRTQAFFITLAEVSVGGLKVDSVRSAVIRGNYPLEVLLGMTFLKQMRIEEDGGLMTLTQRL